jgi:hypothetical protein
MEEKKCKWKSKLGHAYECNNNPLPNNREGYCILHSTDKKKDRHSFKQAIGKLYADYGTDVLNLHGVYFIKYPTDEAQDWENYF